MSEVSELPICRKLMRRILRDPNELDTFTTVPANPDGPEAAAIIKALVEALERTRHHIEHEKTDDIARAVQRRSLRKRVDAVLSKVRQS